MKVKLPLLFVVFLSACQAAAPDVAAPAADAAPAIPASTEPANPEPPAPPQSTIPNLQVTTLDGQAFDLAARRGKWVVVNFWATWCAPCLKEIPDLTAFDAAREDVEVIGLAYEEITPDDMRAFLKQHPAGYPIAIIDTYNPPADFDTPRGLPMTYLISPTGEVAEKFLGPVTSEELAKKIAAAQG